MIDSKKAKQILNEPSSFSVSTIAKKSKFKSEKSAKEDKFPFTGDDFNDTKPLRYYDPTCL
jgi:hypothetical protein